MPKNPLLSWPEIKRSWKSNTVPDGGCHDIHFWNDRHVCASLTEGAGGFLMMPCNSPGVRLLTDAVQTLATPSCQLVLLRRGFWLLSLDEILRKHFYGIKKPGFLEWLLIFTYRKKLSVKQMGLSICLSNSVFPCNTYCLNLDTFYKHLQAIARRQYLLFLIEE